MKLVDREAVLDKLVYTAVNPVQDDLDGSARERWRNGIAAVFPAGTYWLCRFASVPVLET